MPYVREQIHGTSGQDIMKINENFMSIFEKVFGDINFSDTDEALQKSILTQYIPFQGDGNLNKNYPLTIRFYVPPNVKKVNKASLNVFLENYRMDSDITEEDIRNIFNGIETVTSIKPPVGNNWYISSFIPLVIGLL